MKYLGFVSFATTLFEFAIFMLKYSTFYKGLKYYLILFCDISGVTTDKYIYLYIIPTSI